MKKKTYTVLSKIPLVGLVARAVCKPVMFCSPGLSDGVYDDLMAYMQKHPDVLMTEKLAKEIRAAGKK